MTAIRRFCSVIYDVPNHVVDPSKVFKRVGAAASESHYIVPEHRVPMDYIETLRKRGCTVDIIPFDPAEQVRIKEIIVRSLSKEFNRVRNSLADLMAQARERQTGLEGMVGTLDGEAYKLAVRKADNYGKAVLRAARKDLIAAEEAATVFELTGDFADLKAAITNAIVAETTALIAMVTNRKNKEKEAALLAKAKTPVASTQVATANVA